MARDDTHRRTMLTEYITDLIHAAGDGRPGAERAFIERHAQDLGGYTSYLLNLHDVEVRESFKDALRSLDGQWPLSFTGYRLAFPPRLTTGGDEALSEARAAWRSALPVDAAAPEAPRERATVIAFPRRGRVISA